MDLGQLLVLSPHMDDEVLGCGGLLAQYAPVLTHIMYFNRCHPGVDNTIYNGENHALREILQCEMSFTDRFKVNELHTFSFSYHIQEIECKINEVRPDTLLIPFPSYNQDHRRIYEAAITASRPHDKNYYVKNVLVYEQPETFQTHRMESKFMPHLFIPINVDQKLELYKIYQSQQRAHRSGEHITYLAGVRGMQSNYDYAEAFMVLRMTL